MSALTDYFHKKFYSDMPYEQVHNSIHGSDEAHAAAVKHIYDSHYSHIPFDQFQQQAGPPLKKMPLKVVAPTNAPDATTVVIPSFRGEIKKGRLSAPVQRKQITPDLVREDNTIKGRGFFGPLPHKQGGMSTELSISSGDVENGKEALIPTMIPTLNQQELNYLLSGRYNPSSRTGIDNRISVKAIDFARERKKRGLPYFATKQEEGKFKVGQ